MTELEIAQRCAASMWNKDKASQALGIEISVTAVGAAVASMTVRDDMVNGFDVCHGGLVFALYQGEIMAREVREVFQV